MDQIPSYNLLQAIDPTKIKVPISERFAKLTLSSNKKQQQKCNDAEKQEQLKRQQEKRDSVTRNISKQFEDENNQKLEKNPLLRSESSKETECNKSIDAADLTMEPLEVSDDADNPTQVEDDLELLSQQIASMAMEPKPHSLSSGSTVNLSVFTDPISSESQRSSTSEVNNIHVVHHIPINVKEAAAKRETISLNLTSSSNDNFEKTFEMTDDEFEEDVSEEKAITISDTSEYLTEEEQDVMTTSNLPSTAVSSENLSLPSLMDNKAERVAAFLRDVSIEQRAMVEEGHVVCHDTIDRILDNNEIDKIQETLAKSRQIATADTESMTPDGYEEATPISVLEREKRLKALEQPAQKPHIKHKKIITETADELRTPKSRNVVQIDAKNIHRLANDETLDNTVMTEAVEHEHKIDETPKSRKKDTYKIANDETQCNTEHSMSESTPKMLNNNNKNQNAEKSRRLVNFETNDNTELSSTPKQQMDPCRLASEDTVVNTIMTDFEEALVQQSVGHNYSQDYKTPDKNNKAVANDESRNFSLISIHSTSQSSVAASVSNQDSLASILNSSNEINAATTEHSVTILETDDENEKQESPKNNDRSDDKKLSNSFHSEDSSNDSECDEQMSKIQMSMANINISAKINIKIHISNTTSTETSEDDQNYKRDNRHSKGKTKESNQLPDVLTENSEEEKLVNSEHSDDSNEQSLELNSPPKPCTQLHSKAHLEKTASSPNKSSDSVETVEDENFLTEAEKLLNQLYGKTWQTPDVIRTLKHSSQSGIKKVNNSKSSSSKKIDLKNSSEKKSNKKSTVEDSILDDFSIFRRDIAKTNLDSTRFDTPKSAMQKNNVSTEPRNMKKRPTQKEKPDAKAKPQTERKPVVRNRVGRVVNNRWRQLIDDSDSEGDNASDDDDADNSWSKNASELEQSDSDLENSPMPKARRVKNNTTRQVRSDKSNYLTKTLNNSKEGDIIYLDLSKEEVEVQDKVPESPPANHDVTFATHLQDILKSCSREEKSKLPSSNTKTKRKLFTPNFGDIDFLEVVSRKEDGIASSKDNSQDKTNECNNKDEEILQDRRICPFDSQGRPKTFDLINKQLESVKTGKHIFQLTPPSRKNIPGPNSNKKSDKKGDEAIFKTPLTVKSKVPPKTFKELSQTPDYKYSFLKSLDVTVSKSLCHPDALYYRDNYRTKKEDLSKILYDMYNEKLFENKLDLPIKWNKKLSNTAGRCLNKKKLGIRSSVIELSDKVLTSGDRLRCTLIHELCHAATWIFNGESGHGSTWKEWARRANATFPEIPKIGVCHQYDIEYKYTYKCTLCGAKSHAHSKSKKVENIRCSYCHGAIEVFLNKKDKDGNVMPTPVKEPTGFAKFVKDNYKKFKRDDLKHADVMKLLSSEFASLKVASN